MQDERELVQNQSRTDPENGCRRGEFADSPSTANVTMVIPEIITKTMPITTWWMCSPPRPEILRGCHHLRGMSLPALWRM